MEVSRQQLADAIDWWGRFAGAGDGVALTPEVSSLAEVLAVMDFQRQPIVRLDDGSHVGKLLTMALNARTS